VLVVGEIIYRYKINDQRGLNTF